MLEKMETSGKFQAFDTPVFFTFQIYRILLIAYNDNIEINELNKY